MSTLEDMLALARAAREQAYSPYSDHGVGAVVQGASGRLYAGCNVENAAYPEGTCAEAGALAAMVLAGERQVVAVAIAGPQGLPCTPCGGCRQKLREFCAPEVPVHVCDPLTLVLTTTLGALLPHDFGPANVAAGPKNGPAR